MTTKPSQSERDRIRNETWWPADEIAWLQGVRAASSEERWLRFLNKYIKSWDLRCRTFNGGMWFDGESYEQAKRGVLEGLR